MADRLDEAQQTARRALNHATGYGKRGFVGYALYELGEIAAQADPPDVGGAVEHYRQALGIAEELGMRPLQAHTHLSLGKLYRRAGRAHDARAELNVAIDLYLSMEMQHWLPEAEGWQSSPSDGQLQVDGPAQPADTLGDAGLVERREAQDQARPRGWLREVRPGGINRHAELRRSPGYRLVVQAVRQPNPKIEAGLARAGHSQIA